MSLGRLRNNSVPYSFLASRTSYDDARYIVVGVPYDATSSWIPGSRFGPLAIIEASRFMDPFDLELGCVPSEAGIHTVPEISVMELTPEAMVGAVEGIVKEIRSDGKVPILLGGEHTLTLGAIRALEEELDAVVILDAHADFYDDYEGRKVCHATVSKRVSEIVNEVLIYGIRTIGWEEMEELNYARNVNVLYTEISVEKALQEIMKIVRGKKIYLSVDVDVLDPPQVPCIGTPEPGGLSYKEVLKLLKGIMKESEVRAMDFVEFSPCPGMRSDAFLVAKLIYKSIGYHASYSGEHDLGCRPDE